jgi:hypothetical protein
MIQWPINPKDGDRFHYACQFSGLWVEWVYFMGTWQYEGTY